MHVQSVQLWVWGSALLHGSGPQLARPARLCGQLLQQSFHSSAGAFVFFQRWNQAFESSFDFVYNFLVTALKKARQRKRFDKLNVIKVLNLQHRHMDSITKPLFSHLPQRSTYSILHWFLKKKKKFIGWGPSEMTQQVKAPASYQSWWPELHLWNQSAERELTPAICSLARTCVLWHVCTCRYPHLTTNKET